MIFSLKWLNDFVEVLDFLECPEKLSKILTEVGLEVEEIINPANQFNKIIVGQIKTLKKHPNADRLSLCEVEGQKGEILKIVCGASNPKAGDKVVLALPGAVLPGDFVIKTSKIRGEKSQGMLASSKELGFVDKASENQNTSSLKDPFQEGILILPSDATVGRPYSEQLGCNDIILNVNVTPNRSDCLSHLGLAREIACLLDRPLKNPSSKMTSNISETAPSIKLNLTVKDNTACRRYCGRLITGVSIAPSPDWLTKRLEAVGLKSINNVVDVTNYILMGLGQPLHGFDSDKLKSISVGYSVKGEKFIALDDNTLTLTGEELTIRDGSKAIALAGVIGGKSTAITSDTKNVFIEAAYFSPEKVRRSARNFGLETESSYRFSRGIDGNKVLEALNQACCLIQEIAGGKVSKDFFDEYPQPFSPTPIQIQLKDIEERLAFKMEAASFVKWMNRLNCEVEQKKDVFTVQPPSFRSDLSIKEDLIEEIARLEGYHQVPLTFPKRISEVPKDFDTLYLQTEKINKIMEAQGWYQALNYSFGDKEWYENFLKEQKSLQRLGLTSSDNSLISIKNPISSQLAVMKPLLIPDILKNLTHNFRHNNKQGQIFETGEVFFKKEKTYKQTTHLALACWGTQKNLWNDPDYSNLFYLKSSLEHLLGKMNARGHSWDLSPPSLSFIHPNQILGLKFQNQMTGFIGTLHPALKLKYKIPLDVAVGEIALNLLTKTSTAPVKAKPLPEFLSVERDLTFVLPYDLPAEKVAKEIKKAADYKVNSVEIIAIYKTENKRAISFRLHLTPQKKPWTDQDLLRIQDQIVEKIKSKFSISLK